MTAVITIAIVYQAKRIAITLTKMERILERGRIYSTFRISIFCFFNRYRYVAKDTILSNAFPTPNIKAILVSVGVHSLVAYKTNAAP